MDHKTRQRSRSRSIDVDDMGQERDVEDIAAVDSARNQRLIEYALNETPKVRSHEAFRVYKVRDLTNGSRQPFGNPRESYVSG